MQSLICQMYSFIYHPLTKKNGKKKKKKERSEIVQIHMEWQKHNLFQVYVNVLIFCHNIVFRKLSYLNTLKSIKEIHYLKISADRETK